MVIGLVVHAAHRATFAAAASTLSGVEFAWAVYDHEDEIRDRVNALLHDHRPEGLLLGLAPFARARDLIPAGLPFSVTRSAALDLALAWARARGNGWPATPVSIDTFPAETVDEVAAALDLDRSAIATCPFDPDQPVADVVAFHREQLARTGAPYVISVRMGVAAALDGPTAVLHALATPGTIRADLNELALRIRTKRADGRRFAAAVFQVSAPSSDLDRARAGLHQLLLDTPEFADAWIDVRGDRGVLVLAPASLFETVTRQWTALPVLGSLAVPTVAGFGIGASARLSVSLAERAATRAEQDSGPGAYLFTSDGMTIGPMGAAAAPLIYTYRAHGALEDLAERAGLSAVTLSRLAAVERGLDGRPLSPSELARLLGITDPSGRRLIRKLTTASLVRETGSAQETRKGRPTRLYRLAITSALEAAE
jgi:hypothetical protein